MDLGNFQELYNIPAHLRSSAVIQTQCLRTYEVDGNRNEGGEEHGSPISEGGSLSFDLHSDTGPELPLIPCSHHFEILNHDEQELCIFIFTLAPKLAASSASIVGKGEHLARAQEGVLLSKAERLELQT